jgi:hypothetical protein
MMFRDSEIEILSYEVHMNFTKKCKGDAYEGNSLLQSCFQTRTAILVIYEMVPAS